MRAHHPANASRGTALGIAVFYLLIAFEFFYMATPFAVYFYGLYVPGLEVLNSIPALAWLTGFFLPHYAATSSVLVSLAKGVGSVVTSVGVLGFLVGVAQVYSRKMRKRGAAVGGIYRFVRHPQYASLIVAGMGILLLWPRFLMVVFFVTMLFAYRALAAIEERECLQRYGLPYADYLQRTPRFIPLPLPSRLPFAGQWSALWWPTRLLAAVSAYSVALTLALGLAFAMQVYSLQHLYTFQVDDAIYISLTPLDLATLQRIARVATYDEQVRARIEATTDDAARLIMYVMPWEWGVTEIPMNDVKDHRAPGDYDRRRHKVVFTRAVLPNDARVQGIDIVRYTVRTEPVAEAWIDENGAVERVLGPPDRPFYGTVPVPVF
jgi:protein-S-isoprenylcysteine O-methyltransferase Ste14